jgi:hypothetical protein
MVIHPQACIGPASTSRRRATCGRRRSLQSWRERERRRAVRHAGRGRSPNGPPDTNQSPPGDGRGHAQIDAEASPIVRKCPHDIGHHPLSGRCPARLADPCRRKTPTGGSRESHRRPLNSPPSRPATPHRPAATATRIAVAIMRSDGAGKYREIESAGRRSSRRERHRSAPPSRLRGGDHLLRGGAEHRVLGAETCRARQQFDRCPIHASLH